MNSSQFSNPTLEQNPKLGFYTVGQRVFYSKTQALMEATQTGEFPHWNFNNSVYGSLDWLQEPETNLLELYRLRAQQLRDRYDYIRIECSGGADSTQAVFSFLLNDIHLDEVVFRYPKAGEKNLPIDANNSRCENTLSEAEFAAKPLLHWIKTNYPQVNITIHDYSEDMLADQDRDESWVYSAREIMQPAHVTKFPNYGTINHKLLADSGKKICILYGIDKPKICIKDGSWYLYFLDFQGNYANPNIGPYTNVTNEYFYWTPDLPEISVKQAHLIRNWFQRPENQHAQFLVRWPNHSVSQRTAYENLVKPLIYPNYDPLTFQVTKPSNNFYAEMDYWFFENFKDTKLYHSWQAGINLVSKQIDKKFFNQELGKPVGFVGFLSPFYCLGEAVNTNNTNIRFNLKIPDRFDK